MFALCDFYTDQSTMQHLSSFRTVASVTTLVALALAGCGGGALNSANGPGSNLANGGGSSSGSGSGTTTNVTPTSTTNVFFIPDPANVAVGSHFQNGDRSVWWGEEVTVSASNNDLAITPDPTFTMVYNNTTYGNGTGAMARTSANEYERAGTNSWARYFTSASSGGINTGLNGTSYGVYTYDHAGGLMVGGLHNGTPTGTLPATGTATYSGSFTGVSYAEGAAAATTRTPLSGDVAMTANFGTGAISGAVTNLNQTPTGAAATPTGVRLDFSGSTYNSSGYSNYYLYDGRVTTVATGASTNVTTTHGAGTFYGANAAETASTLALKMDANPGLNTGAAASPTMVVGAFGARR